MADKKISRNEMDFALGLLATLPHSGAVVLSPLSISLALALVHAGTRGSTRKELEKVLVGSDKFEESTIQEHFANVIETVGKAENGVQMNIVNRVFVNQDLSIKQSYIDQVERYFKASAQHLDFSQPQEAAHIMNSFVEENTSGKIKGLISEDSVEENTLAFLINAVYFKADWQEPFDEDEIGEREFHVTDRVSRKVPFLNELCERRDYTEDQLFKVLSLKYVDTRFSFAIFLPKKRFGLIEALEKTTEEHLLKLLKNLTNCCVDVHIPKFKIEKEMDLKKTLEAMGVKEIFQKSADLSGLAEKAFISSGIHKAIIEIDENGTTAAAASAFRFKFLSDDSDAEFLADHPFLFVLLCENTPLFIGVYA